VLLALQRPADAIEAFDTFLERGEPVADVYRARGIAHAQIGQYNDALGDYTRALELEPSPLMRTRRGWALLLQAAQLALDDFEQAIQDNPQNPDSYIGRGYAKALVGDYQGAADDADEGLKWARKQAARDGASAWPLFFNAATVFAQAAGRAEAAGQLSDAERQKTVDGLVSRAIAALREALQVAGEANRPLVLSTLQSDEAFDPIRSHPEFRAAFTAAEESTDSATPNSVQDK
jgi:tetratricopeptide (TPR) repeat protein